jgi:hypothetical protein
MKKLLKEAEEEQYRVLPTLLFFLGGGGVILVVSPLDHLANLKRTGRRRFCIVESTAKYTTAASNGQLVQWIYCRTIEGGNYCRGKRDTRITGPVKGQLI